MLKHAILGLLAEKPRHGYDIKNEFEKMLGHTWKLNIGQVYSTLARLERDNLVKSEEIPQDCLPDRKVYSLTDAGREELKAWFGEPSRPPARFKVDFFLKLLVAQRAEPSGLLPMIWQQRQVYLQAIADMNALLIKTDDEEMRLLAEGLLLHLDADMKWLDLCEETLSKADVHTSKGEE